MEIAKSTMRLRHISDTIEGEAGASCQRAGSHSINTDYQMPDTILSTGNTTQNPCSHGSYILPEKHKKMKIY